MSDVLKELMDVYDVIAPGYAGVRVRPWDIVNYLSVSEGLLVDVGCGPCHNGLKLAADRGLSLICMDLSVGMLKVAKALINRKFSELAMRSHILQCDMRFLPLRTEVANALMYIASLNHIPPEYLDSVLAESYRVLKPSGECLITLWASTHPSVIKALLIKLVKTIFMPSRLTNYRKFFDIYVPWRRKGVKYFRYYHIYRVKDITSRAIRLGLTLIKTGIYNPHKRFLPENYYVILRK